MTLRVITGVLGPVFAIASSALCLLLAWGWMSAQTAAFKALPRVSALSALTVTKQDTVTQPESAVALGWRELMQNPGAESAEDRHLQITFSPQGEALLRNLASQRRIALRYADGTSLTDRAYLLKDGDRFRLSGTWFTASVPEDGSGALSIIGAGRTATLPRGYFTAQKGDLDWISHSVSIGGNLSHDPKSWGETWEVADWIRILLRRREAGPILMPIEQLAPDTVRVERINTHYVLRAREAGHVAVCPKDAACFELGRQSWHTFHPVFGALRSVTIGRTSYSVAAQENEITFKPVARGHWIDRDTFEKIRTERAPAATRGSVITSQWRGLGKGPPAQTNAERILRSVQSFYQNEGPAVMLVLAVLFGLSCLSHAGAQSIGTTRTVALVFFAIAAAPGVATLPFGLSLSAAGLFCMALMLAALLRQVWRIANGSGEGWRPRSLIMRIAHGRFTDYLIVGLVLLALLLMSAQPSGSVTGPGAELGPALIALITLFAIAGVCICMLFQRPAVVVFWVSLMIIAGIGIYVQSALVFGQGSARYVILFERHVTVFALLCLFAVSLATAPRTRAISMFEQAIGYAGRDLRMNLLRLGLVLCVALPGLLLTFTSLAFPQALPLELPFSNTVANALIAQPLWLGIGLLLFVAAVFVALWRAHTNPLLKRALAAVHLDREMPIVSGWYLFPTLLLAMVVYVTPETGIAGMQPSELTKSVLAFLFAIFLARWVQTNSWQLPFDRTRVPYEMIGLLIILTVTFILGSVINSDLSPAAIILLMAVGMALSLVLSGAYNFAPFLFSVAVLGLVVALLVMRGGPYGAIDVLWIAVVVLLFLPGLGAARFRRAEHISPFLMRHPISRVMDRLSTAKLMRLKNRGRYPVRVQFVALVGVAVIGALTYGQFRQFSEIDGLRDYEAEVFFYPVPDTPLERVLAFLDANLLAADDPSRDVIVDYPDLSLQVLRSREIIGASGCGPLSTLALQTSRTLIKTPLGAIPPFGFVPQQLQCTRDPALFPQTGSLHPALLALPAVQDDFAVALVFGLLGHDGAALLAVAQIFLMGALVALALQLVVQIRDLSRLRSIGLLGILFLANMVLILLAQFLLSWGNVLGLLPVVGQPMTFISLGASHHLFFALPLCAAALLCASISNALEVYRKGNKRSFTAGWIRQHIRISG